MNTDIRWAKSAAMSQASAHNHEVKESEQSSKGGSIMTGPTRPTQESEDIHACSTMRSRKAANIRKE
jgi:hypothetical protein